MLSEGSDYGLWALVLVNTAIFVIFAFGFTQPRTWSDWRSFGSFTAFLVALFTEMYGFPLTIYLLFGWLGNRLPIVVPFGHDSGHLWAALLGWQGDPHGSPIHLLSDSLIIVGMVVVGSAWRVLHAAQRRHQLAITGLYRHVRHPQYVGFVAVLLGFLIQWPTIPTLLMFPVLVAMYARLARHEERQAFAEFGDSYVRYAAATPAFAPRLGSMRPAAVSHRN
ncbi:MAG: methyltransferase family protein [Chloroflexota bacterium]